MKKLTRLLIALTVCAVLGVIVATPASAWERSGSRGGSFHNGGSGMARSNFRGHAGVARSDFRGHAGMRRADFRGHERFEHHRFHDRDFIVLDSGYPYDYGYYPGPYVNCSTSYVSNYPPIGTLYANLPYACSTLVMNGYTYYTHDGVYYQYTPQGYVVVPPPC